MRAEIKASHHSANEKRLFKTQQLEAAGTIGSLSLT
jgi:hypothetical protein